MTILTPFSNQQESSKRKMIKAINPSELRIGNLVRDETGNTTVVETIIPEHNRIRYGIPLTEEWLLRAGAEKRIGDWNYHLQIGGLSMYLRCNHGIRYSQLEGCYFGDRFQFVHTLQNFKHALTGSELTFKR